MSKSLSAIRDPEIRKKVTQVFSSPPYPTMVETGKICGQTHATVSAIVRETIPADRLHILKVANYSRSKKGEKNPAYGCRKQVAAILRGGYRYLWNREKEEYDQEHRIVLMAALGLNKWPTGWEVHHIDADKQNNSLDNLAIVTPIGHQQLHSKKLEKLYMWEKREFGTSQLKEMLLTLHKG